MDAMRKIVTFSTKNALHRCISTTTMTNQTGAIKIHRCTDDAETSRPLALVLGWLFAKPKHIQKYGDFYMKQGFDVITVQVELPQAFSPKTAQQKAVNILDLLKEESSRSSGLLVHSLSIGGYLYGEMLVQLMQNREKYADVIQMMKGTVYDSPVDYNGIAIGVARAATKNKLAQRVIQTSIANAMAMRKKTAVHHLKASKAFHENELKLPGLFLYSLSDPIAEPEKYERIVESWRVKDIPVTSIQWNDALHVSVYSKYPEEYTQQLRDFIQRSGLKK